jgi:ankyrin repeat protein
MRLGLLAVVLSSLLSAAQNNASMERRYELHDQLAAAIARSDVAAVVGVLDAGASLQGFSPSNPCQPLILALDARNREMARLLLTRGASADANCIHVGPRPINRSVFNALFEQQDPEWLREVLRAGRKPSGYDTLLTDGLNAAIVLRQPEMLRVLIEEGADPYRVPSIGRSPYEIAKSLKDPRILAALERSGRPDPAVSTAELWKALAAGDAAAVRRLACNGANVDSTRTFGNSTEYPLTYAVRKGDEPSVTALLDCKAPAQPPFGYETPLKLALRAGNYRIADMLIERGAPLDGPARNGNLQASAMMMVLQSRNLAALRYLLSKGADPNKAWPEQGSPLMYAVSVSEQDREMRPLADAMIDRGLDQAPAGLKGRILRNAAATGNVPGVQRALRAGADPNAANAAGWTALHFAAQRGADDVLRTLLATDADRHARNTLGMTYEDVVDARRNGFWPMLQDVERLLSYAVLKDPRNAAIAPNPQAVLLAAAGYVASAPDGASRAEALSSGARALGQAQQAAAVTAEVNARTLQEAEATLAQARQRAAQYAASAGPRKGVLEQYFSRLFAAYASRM